MIFKKYFIVIIIVSAILLNFSMLFILLSKTSRLENRMSMSSDVESSFRETAQTTIIRMTHEINTLRDLFNLPPTTFPSFDEDDKRRDASSNTTHGFEIYYTAFEKLYSQHIQNEIIEKMNNFSEEINPILAKYQLRKEQKNSILSLFVGNNIYYSLEYDSEKEIIIASFFPFEDKSNISSAANFESFVDNTFAALKSFYDKAASEINIVRNYINSEDIRNAFSQIRIRAIPVTENNDIYNVRLFTISRINNLFIGTLSYSYQNKGFSINEKFFGNSEEIKNVILNIDAHIDIRTTEERIIDQSILDVKRMAEDSAFKMFLESKGYFLSMNPREDDYHIFFDFLPIGGSRHIGSFAINKFTGETYLVDFEGLQISSIKSLRILDSDNQDLSQKKNNLTEMAAERSRYLNFLICGTNEKNPDTIIIASFNRTNQNLNLISVPRDIYYRGVKLNSYYRNFGPKRFAETITTLTGLEISRYFFIDMFAFIDVVNILGGIEITLDHDLVDPTYRVRNNGEWTTLYYKKGTYHFNGIETLRVARARNFMPAFSRDDRQQKILIALIHKVSELSITDFNRVYNIARTVITYLDTDISFPEVLGLLNDVRNINDFNKIILSTQNVLTQTYTNLMYLELEDEEVDTDFDKGAWILLPQNNNWNSITNFLQTAMR